MSASFFTVPFAGLVGLFWIVILTTTSTAGTTMSDFMNSRSGWDMQNGALILVSCLLAVLAAWRLSEKTISVNSVQSTRAELFIGRPFLYRIPWAQPWAILFADNSGLGFLGGAVLIAGLLGLVVLATYFTNWVEDHVVLGCLRPDPSIRCEFRRPPDEGHGKGVVSDSVRSDHQPYLRAYGRVYNLLENDCR